MSSVLGQAVKTDRQVYQTRAGKTTLFFAWIRGGATLSAYMPLKALLFDVDGTLADTEPHGHLPAYNEAFEELGLAWRWSPELYRELLLLPGGRERIRHYLKRHPLPSGKGREEIERDAQAWVDRLHQVKSRHFRRLVTQGRVPLRPGVRRLIQEARAENLRVGIVTNASQRTLEPFLLHTLGPELRAEVDYVISGEQVLHKKPAPDIYKMALLKLGLKPDECVAIEDSEMGLAAARAARIPTLITFNEDTRYHDFEGAMLVLDQLGEPDRPFTVLEGKAGNARWVTVSLLRGLMERQFARDEEE